MGCTSSKKLLRTKSFKPDLRQPFSRVAAIPIREDFLLANSNKQFVALICKTDSITKEVPAVAKQETFPSSISKDNEGKGFISGKSEKHTPKTVWLDLQSGGLLREEESVKHTPAKEENRATEDGSEENRATEEDKAEIIYTWELMDGLEDGEADHTSEKPTDNGDDTRLIRTAKRLKSMGYFHTLEEYDEVLARRKNSHISEKPTDNGDGTRLIRTAGRSKPMGYFHTLEEYDEVLARSKISHTYEKPKENGDGTRLIRTAGRSKSREYIHKVEEYDAVVARSKTSLWDRNSK
ncbi:hypothetical protein KI387_028015, partial [Taxus chinensis]